MTPDYEKLNFNINAFFSLKLNLFCNNTARFTNFLFSQFNKKTSLVM